MKRLLCTAMFVAAALFPISCRKSNRVPQNLVDGAYDVEPDWNNPQHLIALNYT